MNRCDIIEELRKRGYDAQPKESMKNGVLFNGIIIKNGTDTTPIIYTDSITKNNTDIGTAADEVLRIYSENRTLNLDLNSFFNHERFMNNVRIGMQKTSDEPIIKKPTLFDGIEQYLYVAAESGDTIYSTKVTDVLLYETKADLDLTWARALENTIKESTITPVMKMLEEKASGLDFLPDIEPGEADHEIFVITNKCGIKGASAILNSEILINLAESFFTDTLIIIPSSIHEMLVIPDINKYPLSYYSEMVKFVNESAVPEYDRLTDIAYRMSLPVIKVIHE
ncbi:MAG: DUF5688 family protein [Eubacteriales bacterium]|nr:DUF5688 family protein [Eubacteriales bacterium]